MLKNKILISGGTGFLGKEFIKSIAQNKAFEIHLIIRQKSTLNGLELLKKIKIYNLEMFSLEQIIIIVRPKIVFNLVCSYDNSNYKTMYESNFLFGKNLINSCIKHNIEYFINIHTLSTQYKSGYVITKNLLLNYLKGLNENIKIINISPELIYGNNYYDNNLTKYLVERLLEGKPIKIENGNQKRDFLHVKDLIEAFIVIIKSLDKFKIFTQIDIASGTMTSVKDFSIKLIKSLTDIEEVEIKIDNKENLDDPSYDLSKIKSLGWRSSTSINKGISLIIENLN